MLKVALHKFCPWRYFQSQTLSIV